MPGEAVKRLQKLRLFEPLRDALDSKKPFLGICLGLQLLFERSDESPKAKGLAYFKGRVVKFKYSLGSKLKVPHMGWNTVTRGPAGDTVCLNGLAANAYFYFVHSFYVSLARQQDELLQTSYGNDFTSGFEKDNIIGVQFHPEKSHKYGMRLYENFVRNY